MKIPFSEIDFIETDGEGINQFYIVHYKKGGFLKFRISCAILFRDDHVLIA